MDDLGLPPVPNRVTRAAQQYFDALGDDTGLFHLIADTFFRGDYVAEVARSALDGEEFRYSGQSPYEIADEDPGIRTTQLLKNTQRLVEMFLARAVDNFQIYIVEIIREALQVKPEVLKTSDPFLSMEDVLSFDSIDDLTHDVIERKINSLSYRGFADLEQWCDTRGIPLVVPDADRERLVELIATRNLIAHNRGIVDRGYYRTVSDPEFSLGEVRVLEGPDYLEAIEVLTEVVRCTDSAVGGKFKIEMFAYPPEGVESEQGDEESNEDEGS